MNKWNKDEGQKGKFMSVIQVENHPMMEIREYHCR